MAAVECLTNPRLHLIETVKRNQTSTYCTYASPACCRSQPDSCGKLQRPTDGTQDSESLRPTPQAERINKAYGISIGIRIPIQPASESGWIRI